MMTMMTSRENSLPQDSPSLPPEHPAWGFLKQIFGFSEFRPHQEGILEAALHDRDIFVSLPTGGGKSLCYQLPAMMRPGLTVVVSPLIALMKDQVDAARETGIPSACLHRALDRKERHEVYRGLASRRLKLLYLAPERLAVEGTLQQLQEAGMSAAAVDEAHCISEWGHEFRPDYRLLSRIRETFPEIPLWTFTATATQRVQEDIISHLALRDPYLVRASFDRKELFYRVERKEEPLKRILEFVQGRRNQPGIIYRTTRKDVERTCDWLQQRGIDSLPYHAGLPDEVRNANQEAFRRDKTTLIVATVAFGMGINKPDIRFVIHGDLPKNLEAYYQETGRAGRDGDEAEVLLLWDAADIAKIHYHVDKITDETERGQAEKGLRSMIRYADSFGCRRQALLTHFGESHPGSCQACDVCTGEVETVDTTEDSRKILSAIARTHERFGAHHIVDILKGSSTEKIARMHHQELPTFGIGSQQTRRYWLGLMGDLEASNRLYRDEERFNALRFTPQGRELLFGRDTFRSTYRAKDKENKKTKSPHPDKAVQEIRLEGQDVQLFEELRQLRWKIAEEEGKPPYIIFHDRTLRWMARHRPQDKITLLGGPGMGASKLARYGSVFLEAVKGFSGGET